MTCSIFIGINLLLQLSLSLSLSLCAPVYWHVFNNYNCIFACSDVYSVFICCVLERLQYRFLEQRALLKFVFAVDVNQSCMLG
jgi:hypothetical protein